MILNFNIEHKDGMKTARIWLSGYVKNPILEIKNLLAENEIVISQSKKYILGLTGPETEVFVKTVKMEILIVEDKKNETN